MHHARHRSWNPPLLHSSEFSKELPPLPLNDPGDSPLRRALRVRRVRRAGDFGYAPDPNLTATFETLDDDSIFLILVSLCYTVEIPRLTQLWPLSLTSKRLRGACLPLMFRRVEWPNKRMSSDVHMLPEPLWQHIQYAVILNLL